jgi:ADP-heptose:LPS heptosyltransferase/glycosyltransferase involved in cell wall biosynthesis
MVKISAVILTYNEEKNIERCLLSLKDIVDDIVVLDSFSTDNTASICEKYQVRFFQNAFLGYVEQKNKALEYAKYDYVLSLDADESVSDKLKESILRVKENWTADGYYFNRLTNYIGKWIRHGDWYPDRKLRLWNKQKGEWGGTNPHDQVIMKQGSIISYIKGDLFHYSFYSIFQHVEQSNKFSEILAAEYFKKGKKANFFSYTLKPFWWFIKSYFIKGGVLDGYSGFVISIISAQSNFLKFIKLKQLNKVNRNKVKYKSVIISRTDSIGDVMFTLPLAGILKSQFPEIKICFLGRSYTEPIVKACSNIDSFLNWDEIKDLSEKDKIDRLISFHADAIIHVFPNSDIDKMAYRSKIPVRIGTSHRFHHWLYCNKLVHLGRRYSELHEAQLNIQLLKPFGIDADISLNEIGTYYGLNPSASSGAESLISTDRYNLILHPKSKGSAREWGLDNFGKLIELLPSDKFKIFVSGSKEEKIALQPLIDKYADRVTDISGTMSLQDFITFIGIADGMVAASTGPLHIASALGKQAIGLYAPMHPIHPGRWAPIGIKATTLALNKKCSKCRDTNVCECIRAIQPKQVFDILMQQADKSIK